MAIEYTVTYQKRRTVSIKVHSDLSVEVRAPKRMKQAEVEAFVLRHQSWIEKTQKAIQNRPTVSEDTDIEKLKKEASKYFKSKIEYYSNIMKLYPIDVKITSAKTRFGSCSSKNSICFSYRLMLYPESAREYVVVHELAHIKYKNHGKDFYKLIEFVLPDYKERNKLLK